MIHCIRQIWRGGNLSPRVGRRFDELSVFFRCLFRIQLAWESLVWLCRLPDCWFVDKYCRFGIISYRFYTRDAWMNVRFFWVVKCLTRPCRAERSVSSWEHQQTKCLQKHSLLDMKCAENVAQTWSTAKIRDSLSHGYWGIIESHRVAVGPYRIASASVNLSEKDGLILKAWPLPASSAQHNTAKRRHMDRYIYIYIYIWTYMYTHVHGYTNLITT